MRALHVVAVVTLLLLLASLSSLLRNAQSCACEQTYMYTSYIEVPVLDPRWANHRYKLRLYREAGFVKQGLPPSGLPALLIPGNAGSYEQVRSMASESARLLARVKQAAGSSSSADSIPDWDWYALDLNGELSAFCGQLLAEQHAFALACLRQLRVMYSIGSNSSSHSSDILSQLPRNLRPQLHYLDAAKGPEAFAPAAVGGSTDAGAGAIAGVVLVGHSMGGVVARAAASSAWKDPLLGPGSITLLLTISTPHQYPPVLLQPATARFYDRALARALPPDLPAVSINGGAADMQVSPYLTRLPPLRVMQRHKHWRNVSVSSSSSQRQHFAEQESPALSVSSLNIVGVWLTAGHTQIDWCNQLISRLMATLLEVHLAQHQHLQQQIAWQQQQQRDECRKADHFQDRGQESKLGGQPRRLSNNTNMMAEDQTLVSDHLLSRSYPNLMHSRRSFTRSSVRHLQHDAAAKPGCSSSNRLQQVQARLRQQLRARSYAKEYAAVQQQLRVVNQPHDSSGTAQGRALEGISGKAHSVSNFQHGAHNRSGADVAAAATGTLHCDAGTSAVDNHTAYLSSITAHRLHQFLTSQVLRALGMQRQQQQHRHASAEIAHWRQSKPTHAQQLEQHGGQPVAPDQHNAHAGKQHLHHEHKAVTQPGGEPVRASKAAAAAGGHIASQHSPSSSAAADSGLLLLPAAAAPADVALRHAGACPETEPDSGLKGPEWFVQKHEAAIVTVPANLSCAKAWADGVNGADAVAVAGMQVSRIGPGGAVYTWDVPTGAGASAADFVLLVSAAKPCTGFRVWLLPRASDAAAAACGNSTNKGAAGAAASAGTSADRMGGTVARHQAAQHACIEQAAWADITSKAAPLPVLQNELVSSVRIQDHWVEVLHGKDYLANAAWTLALNHQLLASHRVSRIAVWLAPGMSSAHSQQGAQNHGSRSAIPAKLAVSPMASLTAQWLPVQLSPTAIVHGDKLSSSSSNNSNIGSGNESLAGEQRSGRGSSSAGSHWPTLQLSPGALLYPLRRSEGSPMLLQVQLQRSWQWLLHMLSLQISLHPSANGEVGQHHNRSCWQPVAVYSSNWGGLEHVVVLNTTAADIAGWGGTAHGSSKGVLAAMQHQLWYWLQPWLVANQRVSSFPGMAANNGTDLPLHDVARGAAIHLMLDPECSYSINLGLGLVDSMAEVLLTHASAAAGMAVALLLLVLSHQMSTMNRLLTAVKQGCAATGAAGPKADNNNGASDAMQCDATSQHVLQRASLSQVGVVNEQQSEQLRAHSNTLQLAQQSLTASLWPSRQPLGAVHGSALPGVAVRARKAGRDSPQPQQSVRRQQQQGQAAALEVQQLKHKSQMSVWGADLRHLSSAALRRLRRQLVVTLGGAPQPAERHYMAADSVAKGAATGATAQGLPVQASNAAASEGAVAASGVSSNSGNGVSVAQSLGAVMGDWRVLLVAALFAAAASALNSLNPDNLAFHAAHVSSSDPSSTTAALTDLLESVLHGLLWGVGLPRRGDSPSVPGAAVLLCVALLFLQMSVLVSVAVKWCIGSCGAIVVAIYRCLWRRSAHLAQPTPYAAGGGGIGVAAVDTCVAGSGSNSATCPSVVCDAAGAACLKASAAIKTFFSDALFGPAASISTAGDNQQLHDAAVVHPDQQTSKHQQHKPHSNTLAMPEGHLLQEMVQLNKVSPAELQDSSSQDPSDTARLIALTAEGVVVCQAFAAVSAAHTATGDGNKTWWRRRMCQLLMAVLLLLSIANIALGLAGAVLLIFSAWERPNMSVSANSSSEANQVLQAVQLGSRGSSPMPWSSDTHHSIAAAETVPHTAVLAVQEQVLNGVRQQGHNRAQGTTGSRHVQAQRSVRAEARLLHAQSEGPEYNEIADADATQYDHQASMLQQQHQEHQVQQAVALATISSLQSQPQQQQCQVSKTQVTGTTALAGYVALVPVALRHDAAAARARALHQLSCHMCHAWTVLYGCCCLMLLPSLLAWAQLPVRHQHLSHPLDVLLLLPVLLHCTALSAGNVEMLVGCSAVSSSGQSDGPVSARSRAHSVSPGRNRAFADRSAGSAVCNPTFGAYHPCSCACNILCFCCYSAYKYHL
eukprot:GHRR01005895.1.p1 GENE.GHRR01005895.1~~GHRR01005895.1.p1  ORF type:complete len:2085 (+),score=824.97 GHRR01005895.1:229-6483(+)